MTRAVVLPLLLVALCAPLGAEETFYVSNALGMQLSAIPAYRIDEYDYVLAVRTSEGVSIRRLLGREEAPGSEITRWERVPLEPEGAEEREYSAGDLVAIRVRDRSGRVIEESAVLSGEVVETVVLRYAEGFLAETVTANSAGEIVSRIDYTRDAAGKLIRVDWSGGGARYAGDTRRVYEESLRVDDHSYSTRYGPEGETRAFESRSFGELLRGTYTSFAPQSRTPQEQVEVDVAALSRKERSFDAAGRETGRIELIDGEVVAEYEFSYDEMDNLIETRKRGEQGLEYWRNTYADVDIQTWEYWLKGALRTKWVRDGEGHYEELYASPTSFVRVFIQGETKLREEFYSDGKLVRERRYGEDE